MTDFLVKASTFETVGSSLRVHVAKEIQFRSSLIVIDRFLFGGSFCEPCKSDLFPAGRTFKLWIRSDSIDFGDNRICLCINLRDDDLKVSAINSAIVRLSRIQSPSQVFPI